MVGPRYLYIRDGLWKMHELPKGRVFFVDNYGKCVYFCFHRLGGVFKKNNTTGFLAEKNSYWNFAHSEFGEHSQVHFLPNTRVGDFFVW